MVDEGGIVGQHSCPTCNCLRQLYPRHLLALLGPTDLPNAVKNYENYYFINTNFANRLTYKRRGPRGEHIFALWANTRGATVGCSTVGAPLLDATQWHLEPWFPLKEGS